MAGTLFVVATPIGNLEDISARSLRTLRECSLIAAEDTRRTRQLLTRYGITTRCTSLHEHNEAGKTPPLLARLAAGESIALVSDAGTPTISDPGRRLIQSAIESGIRVESVPGPSAAIAALAVSGFPTDTFTFLGFPPTRSKDRDQWIQKLAATRHVVTFFESPHRIRQTLSEIQALLGDCQILVARELTKFHEELLRGPISIVLQQLETPRGEFTVVIDTSRADRTPMNIGQMHKSSSPSSSPISDNRGEAPDIYAEFCRMTKRGPTSRRQAIGILARRHGLSPNQVYQAIERAKKSTPS